MAIANDEDCEPADDELGLPGDCGSYYPGVVYIIIYLVFSFLVIVNMYIAVILENYSQASEDVSDGITDEDYDLFYEIWQVLMSAFFYLVFDNIFCLFSGVRSRRYNVH